MSSPRCVHCRNHPRRPAASSGYRPVVMPGPSEHLVFFVEVLGRALVGWPGRTAGLVEPNRYQFDRTLDQHTVPVARVIAPCTKWSDPPVPFLIIVLQLDMRAVHRQLAAAHDCAPRSHLFTDIVHPMFDPAGACALASVSNSTSSLNVSYQKICVFCQFVGCHCLFIRRR